MPPPTRLYIITYPDSPAPLRFPGTESLAGAAVKRCRAISADGLPKADVVWCAPEPAAQQTANAFGLPAAIAHELAVPALGRWAGQSLDSVGATDPEGLSAWLTDPHAAPHGGESLAALMDRVGAWLDALGGGRTLAIVHALTGRAVATYALDADPPTMMHLDVPPLGLLQISRADRWRLQRLGRLREEQT